MQHHLPYVLASLSPRRHELLGRYGLTFEAVDPEFDESTLHDPDPVELAKKLSVGKALAARSKVSSGTIIAGDTVVALGDGASSQMLGKPDDRDHAIAMLMSLSGVRHRVISGLACCDARRGIYVVDADVTWVTMRELTRAEIENYVDSGEPFGKAGAYAIQGGAAAFVATREGALDNVIGMPCALIKPLLTSLDESLRAS